MSQKHYLTQDMHLAPKLCFYQLKLPDIFIKTYLSVDFSWNAL